VGNRQGEDDGGNNLCVWRHGVLSFLLNQRLEQGVMEKLHEALNPL
jgi:hypothetical protein